MEIYSDQSSIEISSISGSYFTRVTETEGSAKNSQLEFQSLKLFGRQQEHQQLLEAFSDVANSHCTRVISIRGQSGMGKTALVESLREPATERGAYFVSGKFHQDDGSAAEETYTAIMGAFSDLCDLVIQSDDFDQRREAIATKLSSDAVALSTLISNLSYLLPEVVSSCYEYTTSQSAFGTFKFACKTFLQAMSSDAHPLVIFIDDLQWASRGSQEVITSILEDRDLRNILFVFTYRDEEPGEAPEVLAKAESQTEIQVTSLSLEAVVELLRSQLDRDGFDNEQFGELGRLVVRKTMGNPFHVLQYISEIDAQGLAAYNDTSQTWSLDLERLKREMSVTDSLAEILRRKVERFPPSMQETLMVASYIGYRFKARVVFDAMLTWRNQSPSDLGVPEALQVAVKEGILENLEHGSYQFSHDRLWSAVHQRTIDSGNQSQLRFTIGMCFLRLKAENDEFAFQAAKHLGTVLETHALPALGDVEMAQLNLEAARYCVNRAAFPNAAGLLRVSALLLHKQNKASPWDNNFDLVFEITDLLTDIERILGNLDESRRLSALVIEHSRSNDMKVNALMCNVYASFAANDTRLVIRETIISSLKELGISLPRRPSIVLLGRMLLRVRKELRNKTNEDILSLAFLSDKASSTSHRLMVFLALAALMQDKENLAIYTGLLVMEWTLTVGISQYSASALCIYAVTELALGNYEKAYRFGKLAGQLMRKYRSPQTEGSTLCLQYILLFHWKESIHSIIDPLGRAMKSCFAVGDLSFAMWATGNYYSSSFSCGVSLALLESNMRKTIEGVTEFNQQETLLLFANPNYQCILNLISSFDNIPTTTTLTGSAMCETEYIAKCTLAKDYVMIASLLVFKLFLVVFFGAYSRADVIIKGLETHGKAMKLHHFFAMTKFLSGVAYAGRYRETGSHRYLFKMRKYIRVLQGLGKLECPNSEPLLLLLLAEELSLKKSVPLEQTVAAYELAIESTRQAELVQYEAFACERAGFLLLDHSQYERSRHSFESALELYGPSSWGAIAKQEWLEAKLAKIPTTSGSVEM